MQFSRGMATESVDPANIIEKQKLRPNNFHHVCCGLFVSVNIKTVL